MLTALMPHPSRLVVPSVAIASASGVAGLLESATGCLSLVLVVLFTHFFGRNFGRLSAGFASLGIAGVALASDHPPLASGSIARCAVAIAAAWLCAELVSRRPRQPGSTARLKDEPFDVQVRQRTQTLQSISSLFPGHVWAALPDGSTEYLSPSLFEYTGIKEAHKCDSFRAAIHPDDLQANERYWDALRGGIEPEELEFRLRRSDGEYRWFLCRAKAIRSDSGRLLRWVGVSWDIHDRKTSESLLRTEEETYRRIVDSVPAFVCVGGPAGELLYANKVGVAALGRPMEEILGDGWMACIHPGDVQTARQQWKAHIAAREPVDIAVRMLQHDGVYRWQRLLAEPSRCSNGSVINWYLIGIEIEETIKAQQALAASEREARELLDRLPGRFATRTEQDFDFINQQILEEAGSTLEGMQNLGFLRFIHPDDRDRVKEGYLRSVQEKNAYETTYRWADSDGDYRWRHSRSVPYFNDDGSVYKWYAVNMDIDDLYKSKEVIREREVQLNWLAENVPSLLWRTDSHGRLEHVNKRAAVYTGLRLDELISHGWRHLVHPEDFASTMEAWQVSLESGRPYDW
jgi:PAS domain S-box-containing protein